MAVSSNSPPSKTDVSKSVPRMRAHEAARRNRADEPHDFDALLGPFYDTESVAELLEIPAGVVRSKATLRELLMLRTEDGFTVFPAFQFIPDGGAVPGLKTVLQAFEDVPFNEWTRAIWLVAKNPDLASKTPISWLAEGNPVQAVVVCIRRDILRWRR
ncbi:hypothetical protein [Pseudarthrobacter sp. PS3-L1]|uniref:hypothetical protein n=1 Tax=Pseudarthrobacter sp. PS3-L1 TaxID=3046207 RepID=UPI0024BAB9BB|nr:hypothetical protein [Pseudarthrobacter sp. PS3-L1]MDJ0321952.1 hypothetical protein [Pseudarthrobacter sp. PS3-L1]